MGYTKEAIKGISWLGAFRIFSRVVAFVKIPILARLLSPSQIGLFAICSLVLSFTEIITETGINTFLIQQKDKADDYINTAWVVSILRGFLIGAGMLIAAPFIATFFDAENSYTLLLLTSIIPIIRGFINPSIIKLIGELQFQKEFYYRSVLFFSESLITIVLAYLLKGPEAIVWGLIIGACLDVVISFAIVKPIPRFSFDQLQFRTIIHSGKWLTLAGIFNYAYHHGDDIIVGKILGAGSLGLYDYAYKISMLPITEVGDVVTRVTFPVYTKIADDKPRLQRAFLKTLLLTSVLVIPVGAIFFLFPNQLVLLFLGSQWLQAADVLRVLAVFGILRAISFTTSSVFLSCGRQDILTLITGISFIGMLVSIYPLMQSFGLIGAAWAAVIGTVIALPVMWFFIGTLFKQ